MLKILVRILPAASIALALGGCSNLKTFVTVGATRYELGDCTELGGCAGALVQGDQGAALERGDYDAAITSYSEILGMAPSDADAHTARGLAYLARGNYDQAIADFSDAIGLNPDDGLIYNDRGVAYYRKGDYGRAIGEYNAAIRVVGTKLIVPVW
ncbi:MAG TPA: tetratricopeptide repeat protein, partial [Candidatus Binataceae bacterium]|nr:tetratricopeptide repeat protein [Candidatus Binataceae bacterium]